MPPVSELVRDAGWRQGSVIQSDDRQTALAASIDWTPDPDDVPFYLVVVTQDCDLVRELDVEPFIELVLCRRIDHVEPLYQNGRNPRLLHLPLTEPEERISWLEISIHDRFRICKESLVDLAISNGVILENGDIRLLSCWIARRYTRPAFPDVFNQRLGAVDRQLESLFKSRDGRVVSGLFLDVDEVENNPDTPYDIGVRITATLETWEDEGRRQMLDRFEDRLVSILDDCNGIGISRDDILVLPEDDLTLADLRQFKRLDKDYRSLPEQDGMEQPADGAGEL